MSEAETMEAIARVLGSAQQLAAALAVKRHLVLRWMNGTEVVNRRIWAEIAEVLEGRMTRDTFPDTTAGREAAERHQSMVSLREQAFGYSTQEAPLRRAKPRPKRVALPEELKGWNRE